MLRQRLKLVRSVILLLDIIIVTVSIFFSLQLRFNFHVPTEETDRLIRAFPVFLTVRILAFLYFQTHATLIRFTSREDTIRIFIMLALGTLTSFSGADGTLGLAFAHTGFLFPFFGTLLGWLGVAATGSDTSSNVLFGGLQIITAHQLGISPILMAAANSTGGVMGKIISISSIVVAATATGWYGSEGKILRYVFWSAVLMGVLVGILVMLQAYVWPFTLSVPS